MKPIKIFRGDDTNWNGSNFLNFTVTSQTVDLSEMTARFILGSIVFNNILLETGQFTINFTHEQTSQMPWGINKGILQILDSEGRIKTATNEILLFVTSEVFTQDERNIPVEVPADSPVQITVQISDGSGGGSWGSITGDIQEQTDLQEEFATKQNVISDLETIRSGAALGATALQQSNVTSTYSSTGTAPINGTAVSNAISPIEEVIPAQASSSNQLADKNFVNSSVATNTANFIGTFESVADLEAYLGTITNNDYAFVRNSVVTNDGNDWATFSELNAYSKTLLTNFDYAWVGNGNKFDLYRFDIIEQTWELRVENTHKADVTLNTAYNRYKATVSGEDVSWDYEYTLNNSSFTANQWAAINSGITSSLVTQIGTNTTNISAKQPKTLETPLTIGGTSQTTVEGALGGLNTEVGKRIVNLATGTDSVSIIGQASSSDSAVNIGIGSRANAARTVAIGSSSYASGSKAIAIGHTAFATDENAVSIGGNSYANKPSAIAIGGNTTMATASANSAIQLGAGTNNTDNSFQVFSYQLLDSAGKIPSARLPDILPDQTDQSGKFLTTDGTTASWAEVQGGGGGLSAVYDSATETLTFSSSTPEPPITSHYTFDGNGNLTDCDDKVFLRSSGSQRIDTGITVSDSNKLDIKFKLFLGDLCTLCGIYNTNTSAQYSTNSVVYASNYSDTRILKTNGRVAITPASGDHHLVVSSTNVTLDESVLSWSSDSGNNATGNLNIFAGKFASAISYGRLSINRFKIYDSSNNLLRDFVPVKEGMEIGGNTLMSNGLWDIVNQTFYGNLGSGDFEFHVEE